MCIALLAARQVITKVKQYRLHREDFEVIRIIGKGAFGEVILIFVLLNQMQIY